MIGRDEADRILTGLTAAHERIAAGMFALDGHRGLGVLHRDGLSGATVKLRDEAAPEVDRLWARFTALGSRLEQVRAILGRSRLDEPTQADLARLLTEPSLPVDAAGMPLAPDGTAPDATAVAGWLTVGQLAHDLEQRCPELLRQLSDVEAASSAVATAVVRVSESVDAVGALAESVGQQQPVQGLRTQLAEIERAGLADPLTAAPDGRLADAFAARLRGLAEATEQARGSLAEMVALRDGYPQRRAALAALVDEVAAAEEAVAGTHARVTEKIAEPGLGPVPRATGLLRNRLSEMDGMADHHAWRDLAGRVSVVEQSAREARDRARQLAANAEALLARREELRGRLSAYRAKAAARGLAEDERLTTLLDRAHTLLFTAPCDLRASTQAVHAFQVALADSLRSGERSSVDD
jgi:hypothetical protein